MPIVARPPLSLKGHSKIAAPCHTRTPASGARRPARVGGVKAACRRCGIALSLPDTSSLTLDNLAGTDRPGYAGLEDDVDWHWDRIFAGAALTTLLDVGTELAAPENVNQVGQEMTRRNLNIQPTLTERPGLPVRRGRPLRSAVS